MVINRVCKENRAISLEEILSRAKLPIAVIGGRVRIFVDTTSAATYRNLPERTYTMPTDDPKEIVEILETEAHEWEGIETARLWRSIQRRTKNPKATLGDDIKKV